jgi:branched-chain amino acid aminotransferase
MKYVWIEAPGIVGRFVPAGQAALPVADRGFTYGDGLFETMRVGGGVPLFLSRHLGRLAEGLRQIGFPPVPWDEAALRERCLRTTRENGIGEGVLRLTVTRGSGPRGFDPPEAAEPRLIIALTPRPPFAKGERETGGGVAAILAPWRVDPASPLCSVKHLSALDKVLARRLAREAGAGEALFQNLEGCLTEGAANNLFLVMGGQIVTPALRCGLLPGIARGLLLEAGEALPWPVIEAELPVASLARANEAFLTNAVSGPRPLVAVEGQPIGDGRPGKVTEAVEAWWERVCEEEIGNWRLGISG